MVGIELFCDVSTMAFDEALGRLKAFDERLRRRGQVGGERANDQLMYTWRSGGRGSGSRAVLVTTMMAGAWCRATTPTCAAAARQQGHFKRECPKLRKELAAERALLADVRVEDNGLL